MAQHHNDGGVFFEQQGGGREGFCPFPVPVVFSVVGVQYLGLSGCIRKGGVPLRTPPLLSPGCSGWGWFLVRR